ncbi:hypothetical protein L226DRAFT_38866 [Lentinus tigrinus ALCF2SS1-7]|uniref:Uncharacterized protein n=1 Tax=Lentinus tigrinus ALCF2SS1-6 TaxID=1328759 RepID=A0A5C2SN04_9APHY|nr:hypothetical protein L227DRAFT_571122 [Lentinus tigrinus ALCF2SS1-6]RPD82843.1 hypothetical protein L226DRAFT_38866 [Lentinus tigrinus ALCF2SS1-7]
MSHTVSRRPHPILKRDTSPFKAPALPFISSGSTMFSPHVHFPPTPRIAATYPAHSPTTYDRKPIVVSPNVVQLPQRGARKLNSPPADFDCESRGRSRSRTRGRAPDRPVKGSYFHPRAYEACNPEPSSAASSSFDLPALVHDLSPSDESDDIVTPPGGTSTAGSASQNASLGHAISLHLPDAQKARHSPGTEPRMTGSSFLGRSGLQSPPVRSNPRGRGRPNLTRNGRQVDGKTSSGSFTPDLDEGCLGGF